MEAYSTAPQILQGQPVYQVMGKTGVLPQMQQSVQSNQPLPNVVPSGYHYTHTNNVVNFSELNRSVEMSNMKNQAINQTINQANYVVPNADNTNKILLWIQNPGSKNNTLNSNLAQRNNQSNQLQNLQMTGQGMNNASMARMATSTAQKTFKKPNLANHPANRPANPPANPPAKEFMKIPEPTHVNLNTNVSQKVGSLRIHVSESFLPWNITNKTILDLEFMRHLFSLSGIDIILTDAKQNERAIGAAIGQLLRNKLLSDWLVLKCEEKEIPFLKVNSQVEIYTASNFTALLNVISQETCLPLPFITEENNYIKYLYLNFPKTGNDKVKKLNMPIFHAADNGKKKLPCKYPGIRLDCDFENAVERFTVHVHQSAFLAYQTSVSEIRQHIIYRHIIWGFLQMWIRRVREQYNHCFKFEEIAKSLSLCKADASSDGKSSGSDKGLIYEIGYLDCYLKFDPVTLKETKASFSMDNFSTSAVCNVSIVQYYKQYFLINDMHYSDALRNTALFFRNCNYKNVVKASNCVPSNLKSDRLLPKNNYSLQEQHIALVNNTHKNVINSNLSASTSGTVESGTRAVGSGKNDVILIEPKETYSMPALEKPLLKARTVEEINSSVDLDRRTGFNNSNEAFDVGQITHSKQKDNARQLNLSSFISLIKKFMENCYASNSIELCASDESINREVIERRFDEAVRRAVGAETVELFIEKIYVHLQLFYTNSTCRNILNQMIWRAIEAKYPHLKEHVSVNIAKNLTAKSLPSVTEPWDKNKSLLESESGDLLNVSVIGDKGNSHHKDHNDIATLAVGLQSETTTSESEVRTHYSGENAKGVSAVSEERNFDPGKATSPRVSPRTVNEQELPVPSKNGEPNEGNACSSDSPAYKSHSKKNKKRNKKKRSEKWDKEFLPYTNTLTFVRVSTSPATFRISKKSRINSANQSLEAAKNESYTTPTKPPTPPTVASNEILETEPTPKEQEQSVQTVEKSEIVDKECPREKDYSEYDLKPCSVVLNSNDVEMYMEKRRKRKMREASLEESDSESEHDYVTGRVRRRLYAEDSDDNDFLTERKKLKRKVSEMQYMEARTRVLQRLRKRKSLYIGYERTRISGEELDNFFVEGSMLSKMINHERKEENEAENEHEDEDEYEVEEEKDSEANESQLSEIQMEKEPAIKELRVLLVRLEDTPEYEKYRDHLLRKEKWNPPSDSLNHENFIPLTKKKYFDVRGGKLYLKEEYRVKNGVIVRTDKENSPMRPKREPESPMRETDFDPNIVKKEGIFD